MISFRYHIVSLVAVFLALAVGVALGGGPLQGKADTTLVDQVATDRETKTQLQDRISALRATNAFTDHFAAAAAPRLVAGALRGHVVSLVVLPGAAPSDVKGVRSLVRTAGGAVGTTVQVDDSLLDPSGKQLVDELGTQLGDRASGVRIPADASPYQRLGGLLARAVGTDHSGGAAVDGTATSILAGLDTAKLVSAEGAPARRGDLVLLVAGDGTGQSADEAKGAASIVTTVAETVDQDTAGAVLAGPVASASSGGLVAALRGDAATAGDVSTVDALGRTAGQVVTVLALAGQAAGRTGHYGAVDAADGAVPPIG